MAAIDAITYRFGCRRCEGVLLAFALAFIDKALEEIY